MVHSEISLSITVRAYVDYLVISGWAVNRRKRPNCEALGFLGSDLSTGAIFVIKLFLFFN